MKIELGLFLRGGGHCRLLLNISQGFTLRVSAYTCWDMLSSPQIKTDLEGHSCTNEAIITALITTEINGPHWVWPQQSYELCMNGYALPCLHL